MFDKSLFQIDGIHKVLALLLVLNLAMAATIIGQAWSLATSITNLWGGETFASQLWLVVIFFVLYVGKQLLTYIQDTYLDRFARTTAKHMRGQLLDAVFVSQSGTRSRYGTAELASSAIEGIDQIENYLRMILPKMVGLLAIPIPILVAVFLHHWISGIVLLVMFPAIIFYMIFLGRQAQARAEEQYETYTVMSNHFIDTLRGLSTLKAFGASKGYGETIYKVSEDFRRATIRTLRVATLSGAVLDLLATMGVAAVAIMLGFGLMEKSIGLYVGLFCLILAPEYFKPIREFASDFHASLDGKNAMAAVAEVLRREAEAPKVVQREIAPWSEASVLELEGVRFAYQAEGKGEDAQPALGNEVLKGISFSARGFAKIGVVGISGSGKSTLVNLLGGFELPTGGTIKLNGEQLPDLRQKQWQDQAFYIPQDPYIFNATLRENIAFYSPEATDEEIQQAVQVVGLQALAAELSEGLNTVIGEGGRGLSGGQAQRIALARALLDPSRKVLLFDEPTAHLDIETEYELKARMLQLMEGHLVIFATHRLHWLANMDHILVIEDGVIAEQGTLDELMAANGALVRMVARMNKGQAV